MDEPALRQLARRSALGRRHARRGRAPVCGACPSPISGSPGSTTTAHSGSGCGEAVYGPGKTAEQCARIVGGAPRRSPGGVPVLLTRADSEPGRSGERMPRRSRDGHQGRGADRRWRGGRRRRAPGASCWWSRPVPPTCLSPRNAWPPCGAYGLEPPSSWPTAAWPGSTASSPRSTSSPSADAVVVVAGMEGALASLVGGISAGTGRGRADLRGLRGRARRSHRAAGHARVMRGGTDRGRDRQRLRRRRRRRPDPPVSASRRR